MQAIESPIFEPMTRDRPCVSAYRRVLMWKLAYRICLTLIFQGQGSSSLTGKHLIFYESVGRPPTSYALISVLPGQYL